ncbi:hypothetical protein [Cellulomonas sp. SLBN-39]|uniref:hypothetical protein n=1 Tax=Cellulomonas sp. SLBN-39 TaxID=2768446 RepID=UPI00115358C6|nr:hypothetical protein [Cellulomonas sp. SLBN-39]TQL01799.1 hypothetical protein FBY24_0858 [Cellulomonas sp. SLBN-39]
MSDPTTGYDPQEDPDSDPQMLNPREGAQASAGAAPDADGDPDADPDALNPRADEPTAGG